MRAFIFPGQGAQFAGMGKELYGTDRAKRLFDEANDILGFKITDVMFEGSAEDLKQTGVTQPAVFLHSVILTKMFSDFNPDMVAGHSLGEFSALVAAKAMTFESGLKLVSIRAAAMQKACEKQASTMAAILGLDNETVERICRETEGVVVPANYNCPGQLVISGTVASVEAACEKLKAAGAKRALLLPVGGAFHSPLMESARAELETAINVTAFDKPVCPVYQNVDAKPYTDPTAIKRNLVEQLTAPVRWTQTVQNMIGDGARSFVESGPGTVLQGLVKKIDKSAEAESRQTI